VWVTPPELEPALLERASDGPGAPIEPALAAFPPGRRAGLARLAGFDVRPYARGRNFAGERRSVSALSPYLRHGLVSLPEARDHAVGEHPHRAGKFVQELAWREYWRHVLDRRGRAVYADVERPKHAHHRAPGLPEALVAGETGLACVDGPRAELVERGYVHNHARMWFASATTHLFQRDHASGAALFAEHLLDHDPASNSLSWQWVESSFAHRPYLYNRENVERYAPGLCERCPAGRAGRCPVEGSYAELGRRLLGSGRPEPEPAEYPYGPPPVEARPPLDAPATPGGRPVTWLSPSSLGTIDPALALAPQEATVAIVFDAPHLDAQPHAAKRLAFLARSALETADDLRAAGRDVRLAVADPAQALLALAPAGVWTTDEPDPWLRDSVSRVREAGVEVHLAPRHLLAPRAARAPDSRLARFSRWWRSAEREALPPAQLSLDA